MYKLIKFTKTGISVVNGIYENANDIEVNDNSSYPEYVVIDDNSVIVKAFNKFKPLIGTKFNNMISNLVKFACNPALLSVKNDDYYDMFMEKYYNVKRTPKYKAEVSKGILEHNIGIPEKEYQRIYKKGYTAGSRHMKTKLAKMVYERCMKNYYLSNDEDMKDLEKIMEKEYISLNDFKNIIDTILVAFTTIIIDNDYS